MIKQNQELRKLETIFSEHIKNSLDCSQVLYELYSNTQLPSRYIDRIKQLEEIGDQLTAEAFNTLEYQEYSDLTHFTEDLIKSLDDIIDGFNKTARLIDIFQPIHIEEAAFNILHTQQEMLTQLLDEFTHYPDNTLTQLRITCQTLKTNEQTVDQIYHEWRKKERRDQELSIVEESNWTEMFGILEQTTDDIYHTGIQLERLSRYKLKMAS